MVLRFDSIVVATIQPSIPDDSALLARAGTLAARLEAALAHHNLVVAMKDVPTFEQHGYAASTYMLACPPEQYPGCALVVARRGDLQWATGGVLTPTSQGDRLAVTFVDVRAAREVLAFDVVFDGVHDELVVAGIVGIFDRILQGGFTSGDARDLADPATLAIQNAAREELIKSSLVELATLGAVVRPNRLDLAPEHLSRLEIVELALSGEAPWKRVAMTPGEYRVFHNSGLDVQTWDRRRRGVFGAVLLDAGFIAGSSAAHHRFDGKALLDDITLQPIEVAQVQETTAGAGVSGRFAVGFGVLPWLGVNGTVGLHAARFTVDLDEDVVGQPVLPGSASEVPITTTSWGASATFVPLPRRALRPRAEAGVATWTGRSLVPEGIGFVQMKAPTAIWLEGAAGAEASLSEWVVVHALIRASLGVAGDRSETLHTGVSLLDPSLLPVASGGANGAIGGGAGLTIRIPLLKGGS